MRAGVQLAEGETLGIQGDTTEVESVTPREAHTTVYNIEVEGDYVYRVGQSGVLVDNASDDEEGIYRATVQNNGEPKLGESATTLGVRKDKDVEVDEDGNVHLPAFNQGEKNGVSCVPTIKQLPGFAVPEEWGGKHKKTNVWKISEADLGDKLIAKKDGTNHISIGPSTTMSFDDYVRAVQATSSKWVKVECGNGS